MKKYGINYFLACMMAVLGCGTLTNATEPPPDFTITFPAGMACNFDLIISGWGGKIHDTVFKDKNGFVRSIQAGVGSKLLFMNGDDTAKTFSSKSNGSITHTTLNPDGSYTQKYTGHMVLFMYPTDYPPGPSATLYTGMVEASFDTELVTTVLKEAGKKFDICAAVSQ
jgi:hypothetical protein